MVRSALVETPVAPTVREPLDPALRTELLADVEEQGQVTVRCRIEGDGDLLVRIWPSTFLIGPDGHRSRLLHAEGIVMAPHWMAVPEDGPLEFILVFEPLPRACTRFDLVEVIPQPGGFAVTGIPRNNSDLYEVWF